MQSSSPVTEQGRRRRLGSRVSGTFSNRSIFEFRARLLWSSIPKPITCRFCGMASIKRKERADRPAGRYGKRGRRSKGENAASVDPEHTDPEVTSQDSGDGQYGFLLGLASDDLPAGDEPVAVASQHTQKLPAHSVAADGTVGVEDAQDAVRLTPNPDDDKGTREENDKGRGTSRCRWSGERQAALVRQVRHHKPTAPGISNKERSKRWKDVCFSLQASVGLFKGGISVEAAKQQLRKIIREGKAIERGKKAQTGPGDEGQHSDLHRARVDLLLWMQAEEERLERKRSAGQGVRAMSESGRAGWVGQPSGRSDSQSLTSRAMGSAEQHMHAMQGHLEKVAQANRSEASNGFGAQGVEPLLLDELKACRKSILQGLLLQFKSMEETRKSMEAQQKETWKASVQCCQMPIQSQNALVDKLLALLATDL